MRYPLPSGIRALCPLLNNVIDPIIAHKNDEIALVGVPVIMSTIRTHKPWFAAAVFFVLVLGFFPVTFGASNVAGNNGKNATSEKKITILPGPAISQKVIVPQQGITVEQATVCSNFTISSSGKLSNGVLHKAYRFQIQTSGGVAPVAYSLMKQNFLPPGLKIDSNGWISGIPRESGKYSFTITAFDRCPQGSRSVEKRFSMAIIEKAVYTPMAPETRGQLQTADIPSGKSRLVVTDLQLSFRDGKANTVVTRNQKVPELVARFRLNGSGMIAGYWATPQGKKFFFRQQVAAPEAKLLFPATDSLLTVDAGQHEIRMVLSSSQKGVSSAVARYFVIRETGQTKGYIDGQLVVTVDLKEKDRIANRLSAKYRLRLIESHELKSLSYGILLFETDGDIVALSGEIESEAGVVLAQSNHIFRTMSEPKEKLQDLSRHLQFSKVHDISQGRGVTVAVIDTGVDVTHEDLHANIQDHENFISGETYRGEIHGTAVAGTIAAGINDTGITGVAPQARILALRACTQVSETRPQGQGNSVSITRAIDFAVKNKANIVNMSFGSRQSDRLIAKLIEAGVQRGVLFVAPVGNRRDLSEPNFPASCEAVIAVGGMQKDGEAFPNGNLVAACVCAPCENVFTTIPQNGYNFLSGTSISAAVVSGVLALTLEKKPTLRSRDIPRVCGDVCLWTATLMGISLCQ